MSGWFAMSRAMFEHPLFAGRPDRIAAWAWIIAKAAWKDTRQNANGKIIVVKRGQLLTSYRQMSRATGVPVKPLRTLISALTDENAIGTDTGTGRLLITIRNYDRYQSPSEAAGTGGAHEGHTRGTQKNKGTREQDIPVGAQAPSEPIQVSVVTTALWNVGKQYLASHGVPNPGAMIGRWLKSNDPVAILNAIEAAQKSGTHDPVPYITETLKQEPRHGKPSNKSQDRFDAFIAGARGTS